MRYQTSTFGEPVTAMGQFETGDTVTADLFDIGSGASIAVSSSSCTEIGTTGFFRFPLSNIVTPPTSYTEILYIMTNQLGRVHSGKVVVGGHPDDIAIVRFRDEVLIDASVGSAGTAYPLGTPGDPVNNFADALAIAQARDIFTFRVRNVLTITDTAVGYNFRGLGDSGGSFNALINLNGQNVGGSSFENCVLQGDAAGSAIFAVDCAVGGASALTDFSGLFTRCGLSLGTQVLGGAVILVQCYQVNSGASPTILDLNSSSSNDMAIRAFSGALELQNMVAGVDVAVDFVGGEIVLAANCTGGLLTTRGDKRITRNDGGAVTVVDLADLATIRDLLEGKHEIDQTTDPWEFVHYDDLDSSLERKRFQIFDQDDNAVNNSNPLGVVTFIGRLEPV